MVIYARFRRVTAGRLRGECLSSLSKRGLPAVTRRNEASTHNPSMHSSGAIAWNKTPPAECSSKAKGLVITLSGSQTKADDFAGRYLLFAAPTAYFLVLHHQ
jgi:hypothetical protein